MYGIVDKTEVTTGFTITVNINRLVMQQAGNPLGYDRGIGAFRVLAWSKYIEIAQAWSNVLTIAGSYR